MHLLTVTYDGKPLAVAEARNFDEALRIGRQVLRFVLASGSSRLEDYLKNAPDDDIAKLKVRRSTDRERYMLAAGRQQLGRPVKYVPVRGRL